MEDSVLKPYLKSVSSYKYARQFYAAIALQILETQKLLQILPNAKNLKQALVKISRDKNNSGENIISNSVLCVYLIFKTSSSDFFYRTIFFVSFRLLQFLYRFFSEMQDFLQACDKIVFPVYFSQNDILA
ncbi:MAG: hypothetical protein US54_C0001G0056 [Candidatus Roizmanbacteria bacterium GW2011_GWA2_37_7]|uniref:Uncharacterized protein n=1 Tax=Candidatus Roizmanbacteria bacterium GW2011_GWA2_37_7 TaxID=1618481 RepID=A0A0G0KEA9_9BACT|nr:MAG: hypothetical protein US54_C0001G0056 [Candidatus Roizmanbacteria bacterium GW2011_GWA2_37_7]